MKIYFYKMTNDDGGAPCCTFGRSPLWSLAICKPRIRSTADKEDIVIGFAGLDLDESKGYGMVHIARVKAKLAGRDYYARNSFYRNRGDCIYEWNGAEYRRRPAARFHAKKDMPRDLGSAPNHPSAWILISEDFRYFGRNRLEVEWQRYPALRRRLENLRQGHRVYHSAVIREELEKLVNEAFARPFATNRQHTRGRACAHRDDDHCGVSQCGGS